MMLLQLRQAQDGQGPSALTLEQEDTKNVCTVITEYKI